MTQQILQNYNGYNVTAQSAPERPVTYVPTEDGYTTITTQVNDTVYVMNSRTNTYKHTAHRVRRIEHGLAVTYCTVWARGGTVMPLESDCFVWCEYGCKPQTEGN